MAKRELYGLEETVCAHMSGARKRTSTYRCCMAKSIVYVSGSLRTSMYEHKKRRKRTDVGDARVRRPDPFSLAPAGPPHPHKHTCLFGQEGKLARAFYNCDFAPPLLPFFVPYITKVKQHEKNRNKTTRTTTKKTSPKSEPKQHPAPHICRLPSSFAHII